MGELTPFTKWNDRLAFDLALTLEGSGDSIDEVRQNHKLSKNDLKDISRDPVFQQKVRSYREDIAARGLTFRLKARAQAEELLTTSWDIIHSNEVSATVKADLIKATVKWGGLEPKDGAVTSDTGGVSITINLGEAPQTIQQAKVIDV